LSGHIVVEWRATVSNAFLTDLRRYRDLIRGTLGTVPHFTAASESSTAIQVERGIAYAQAVVNPEDVNPLAIDPIASLAAEPHLGSIAVVDRSGHHRPVYRGLFVYAWLQAFSLLYERLPRVLFGRWEESLRTWCDLLEAEVGQIEWPRGPMPAGRGSSATESAWMALALHVAGKLYVRDAWTDLASETFGRIVGAQLPHGPFLQATGSDNPETHWYHELVVLHAAASYAVQAEDRRVAAAVAKNAEFHLNETQPDHATTQPWGLFAFIWNDSTRVLADGMLHAAADDSGIALMLLADALYCVELFTE
jgi:hypothetical protein